MLTRPEACGAVAATSAQIESVEARMLRMPQLAIPLRHQFAPGCYIRTIVLPAGAQAIGHEHTTDHFNIILRGRVRVLCGGKVEELTGPCIFVAAAGSRKVVLALEETEWANVHPTNETDLEILENTLVRKSAAWQLSQAEAAALANGVPAELEN
jgi:quercetin dioxygenase-like cupin family protein